MRIRTSSLQCWTGARILDLGVVQQFSREGLTMGVDWNSNLPADDERNRIDELVGLLRAGGGHCDVTDDIQSERWVKLAW
jgi:hypothetical protein